MSFWKTLIHFMEKFQIDVLTVVYGLLALIFQSAFLRHLIVSDTVLFFFFLGAPETKLST